MEASSTSAPLLPQIVLLTLIIRRVSQPGSEYTFLQILLTMSSTELVQVRNAVSQISRGKDVNEDSWMVMWCNTNWGDLLQPAPLSIALLGSLMVIASSTNDFSLISENKSFKFTHAKYPSSFKTCLQQMVGDGYTAFETASHQMTRINNASGQLPEAIKRAVTIIIQSTSPIEVEYLLPNALDSISELTNICVDASRTCERAFVNISALAQEILECTTYKVGSVEQVTVRNEIHLSILQQQAEQEEKMVKEAKETSELMKNSFSTAEQEFKTAVDSIPSGWDIVGMHVVESLTDAITAPINAVLGKAKVKSDYLQTGSSSLPGNTTQPSGEALSDPAISLAQQVLGFVSNLKLLISGGPGGKPDWDNIRGSNKKSGGLYVQASLERMMDRLDKTKPISSELLPILEQAVRVTKAVNATAMTVESGDDRALNKHKSAVNKMIKDLQGIVTRCNLILQQTGNIATGPGTAKSVPATTSHTQAAVEASKFRVDQTRANLEAARESYDKASTRLIEGQREITKTIASMTQLSLENATLKEILPVLMQAVKAFTTLRAQFSQMTEFFCNVASLINDVMKPQVTSWVKNIESNSKMVLAGVSLSDWARHAMYAQMMGPLKVSMLAERISQTYLRVSDLYIMPAQREVGHLLQFQEDRSEEGKQLFRLKLGQAQAAIQEKSQTASQKILELVAEDQKKFVGTINQRLERIQDTVGRALPAIREPGKSPLPISDVFDRWPLSSSACHF
ncbi:hypothetical protein HD554DRAFT_1710139 [Boletus coccyginus]|nr:hypothetical protein HD554DRAFT_1710139 [Boletus coccyginus]